MEANCTMKISSEIGKPPLFHLVKKSRGRVDLASSTAATAHLFVLEEDVLRVIVLPEGKMRQSATWSIAPGQDDVPTEGRDRFSVEDFSCPEFTLTEEPDRLRIETTKVRLTVELNGLLCTWELRVGNTWRPAARDRRTQAYNFGWWDEKVYHYLELDRREMFFGLGEKSGETNRAGRRFRMCNLDAMGYSAKNSDPLYKHIPFSITWNPQEHLAFGLFYDTLSECTFDLGCERDNYHGRYRYFMAEFGDLDYYFIAGPAVADVTRRYTWLTGRPALMPRWALSYSGSTMSYTDAPDAQRRMGEFLNRCTEHRVFCESFHLSSGYTAIGNKRYVFHWSKERFPDPQAFTRSYAEAGVHLCANIKPCLLHDHPLFEEARQKHLLLADKNGNPAMVQFWDDTGAYLDFTHPETLVWWKEHVKSALLAYGISSTHRTRDSAAVPAADDARLAPSAARRAFQRTPLCGDSFRIGRYAPLCADLDRRQLHFLGDAAIQPQNGAGDGAFRHLQLRSRCGWFCRTTARSRTLCSLGCRRYLLATLFHPLVERRPNGE
jgi:alpha-glucosidase